MKKFVLIFAVLSLMLIIDNRAPTYAGVARQPQAEPGPGKKFVQGLFGLLEVDVSDPRPGVAFGPPLQPAAPAAAPTPAPPAAPLPAAAQPVPPPQPQVPDEVVKLDLVNQELHQAIRVIAGVLGINYLIDPTVRGTVDINTAGNLRRSELLPVLEAILKMNGATMVKAGNLYQIVPANTAVRMPLEVQNTQSATQQDDQVVLQIVPMKFVAADEMARVLTPYLSEAGNIVAQGNVLLITDRRSNLRKLLEIVDEFDSSAFQGQRVRMIPVKNSNAKDLVDDLKTVFGGYALSDKNSAIRFVAMDRMNSILVIAPNPAVFTEVERWMERLDQPLQIAGLRTYVYRAKNTKALDIQKVLNDLYSSAQNPTASPARPQVAAVNSAQGGVVQAAGFTSTAPSETQPAVEAGLSARLSGQIHIVTDTTNNALVIQASPQDYQALQRTIEELDVLPRQVLIDAQVYEVVLDHSLALGLSAVLQNRGTLANPQTTANILNAGTAVTGQTFAFIGRARELVGFLNASENSSRVRTLSAPSILVSNNATASVEVGAEVPIPTSSAATPVQQGGTNFFAQTISFRDTGVILNVTPQINEGGNVTLVISQEVSQAEANTTSSIAAPVIGKSSVRSTIVVHSGETIPITGFIRENEEVDKNRIPLLGSIPFLGPLFGSTSKSKTRTELIVLITPHVITTGDERAAAAEELKAKLKEIHQLIN